MIYDRATTLSFHNHRKHIDTVSRDAMEYPLSIAVHHRGRSGVLIRLRPAEKTSFETTPDLASIRRSERVLLRNSSLQSNARQIAGARSCMVQPSRPR